MPTPRLSLAPSAPCAMPPASAPRPAVRPLWSITGATAWLRKYPDDIVRMVEDGRLEWAWDIAAGLHHRRREIRIWFESLEAARRQQGRPVSELIAGPRWSAPEVLACVIGHQRPTLRGSEVQALLNCDVNHVARLLKAGELRQASRAAMLRCHTPVILRDSLVTFLLARRIQ